MNEILTPNFEASIKDQNGNDQNETARDALLDKLITATLGFFDIYTVYIGDRLALYRTLAQYGPMTSHELARQTGTQERYVREWLEQQTVSGILAVDDETREETDRRYSLPGGHDEVLTSQESLNYLAPLAQLAVGAAYPIARVLQAFRNGGGVAFADYGSDLREGQAAMNRAMFLHQLGQEYLPAIPDLHTRLQSDHPARIADIGCGGGWSSIGMALAYPNVQVDGYDMDAASVELARQNLQEYKLNDRVSIRQQDAGQSDLQGQYDLVTAFECVHDMGNPVGVLSTMRRLAGSDGTVLVMDERVADRFSVSANEVEQMMYGWSLLHCLPVGMAEHHSVGTGTVMRADTLQRYAEAAGFRHVEILPLDNYFFRFYRLYQ